jgi:hypothetical protein
MKRKVCLLALFLVLLTLAFGTRGAVAQGPQPRQGKRVSSVSATFPATAPWFANLIDRSSVGAGDERGKYVSLAFDTAGNTAYISYYDVSNHDLRAAWPVTSGGNCGLNNTWYCETVDSAGDVGMYSSIAVFGSNTGIAYYDATNSALKFAERTCHHGVCSWSIVTIEDPLFGSSGSYASLKYDSNGVAHIAYYYTFSSHGNTYALAYAYSVASGGNCVLAVRLANGSATRLTVAATAVLASTPRSI